MCEDRDIRPHPWLIHIHELYILIRGGLPFAPDDLSLEEWWDLGMYREMVADEKTAVMLTGRMLNG